MTIQDKISGRFLNIENDTTILEIEKPTKEKLIWIRHYLIQIGFNYFETNTKHYAQHSNRFFNKNQEFVLTDLIKRYDLKYKFIKLKSRSN